MQTPSDIAEQLIETHNGAAAAYDVVETRLEAAKTRGARKRLNAILQAIDALIDDESDDWACDAEELAMRSEMSMRRTAGGSYYL